MVTRICHECLEEKPITEFHFRNEKLGTRREKCRLCVKKYHDIYYPAHRKQYTDHGRRNKPKYLDTRWQIVIEHLASHPCVDCGESDPVVLEFDHVRGVKRAAISLLVGRDRVSIKTLKEEIDKCDIRCANCHRRKTAKQLGWRVKTVVS